MGTITQHSQIKTLEFNFTEKPSIDSIVIFIIMWRIGQLE